jgi:hypothetical protein
MNDPVRIGEILWQTMPESKAKYQAYLCSREWALLKEAVKERCGGICERCHANPMENVHHLTYERKYAELLTDLSGWCKGCHDFTHGKSDVDPLEEHRKELKRDRPFDTSAIREYEGTLIICPFCESYNCHISSPKWDDQSGDGNQGRIIIPIECESGCAWDLVFIGHKGSLVAMIRNIHNA